MNPTSVIDTADWLLAVPAQQPAGLTLDFSGTRLMAALTPVFGGEPIQVVTSDDGSLAFVPGATPYFTLDLRVRDRTWSISQATTVFADIKRYPDPDKPYFVEWLGRIALRVHPGTDSAGISVAATSPVLIPIQPFEGRLVTTPLIVGPQGAPAGPPYDPITDEGKSLKILNGAPAWV